MTEVYVLHQNGNPLMPTNPAKARVLLKLGRAKVVSKEPFTIRLLYKTTEYTQELTLGVDPGSGTAGFSVVDEKGRERHGSEVQLRQDVHNKMDRRRVYRRNRRGRKTRYRKPRFLNRAKSKRKGRLSPTLVSKIQAHEREIKLILSILPITKAVFETAQFDLHALADPAVLSNFRLYQEGPQFGFENVKAFVMCRDDHTCQCCKGKTKDKHLHVHHKVYRSQNGKDTPDNLVVVCKTCHNKIHSGELSPTWKGKQKDDLSHATQVNVIAKNIGGCLKAKGVPVETTYGFVTKLYRQSSGLPKTHSNDALVIAAGDSSVTANSEMHLKKCVAEGDYQLAKGHRSEKKIDVGKINGFRKFDKVRHKKVYCFIKGRMSTGYMILMDIHGKKIDFKPMPKPTNTIRIRARRSTMSVRINKKQPQ